MSDLYYLVQKIENEELRTSIINEIDLIETKHQKEIIAMHKECRRDIIRSYKFIRARERLCELRTNKKIGNCFMYEYGGYHRVWAGEAGVFRVLTFSEIRRLLTEETIAYYEVELHQDIVNDAVRHVRDNSVQIHQSVADALDEADYSNECLEGKCVDGKEEDE
jgi:hypothetical protein